MSNDRNYCCLAPLALGLKTSPFSAMMGVATNPHSPWLRKNGDEGSSEAAQLAATSVVDRARPTVSHPPGLEASPTGHLPTAFAPTLGPPTARADHDGHDLGGGRFPSRDVRDGTRVLRRLLRGPQTSRRDPSGISEGAFPHPPAPIPGVGRRGAAGDPDPLRRPVAGQRLRADGLRWLPNRVPTLCGVGGPSPAGGPGRLGPDGVGDRVRAPGNRTALVVATGRRHGGRAR